jgi:hypothetical protein
MYSKTYALWVKKIILMLFIFVILNNGDTFAESSQDNLKKKSEEKQLY